MRILPQYVNPTGIRIAWLCQLSAYPKLDSYNLDKGYRYDNSAIKKT